MGRYNFVHKVGRNVVSYLESFVDEDLRDFEDRCYAEYEANGGDGTATILDTYEDTEYEL